MVIDLSEALPAAKSLIGCKLTHDSPEGRTAGVIVETEVYMMGDPASHTFRGPGARNRVMFGPAAGIYVYLTYGLHYCVNIVTGGEGDGQGVLLRALQPVEGLELMRARRGLEDECKLANGPGKLAQAMGMNLTHNGVRLGEGQLHLERVYEPDHIIQTTRIGITKAVEKPWRFLEAGNRYVSRPPARILEP